jgi:serine/threonine-protein kinase
MDPLGIAITAARGVDVPSAVQVLWTYLPNYVCAFLALLPSHIIVRLGGQVSEEREVGSYRLGQLLGQGGMGEVYRATHRMLRRPAAIKLVRPDALGTSHTESAETLTRRFLREAQAAASLHSPHTIALYDFGTTDDGDLYYVMELLYGLDLESLVKRFGPMSPARVAYLLRQACHSLAEAHAAGLIHRDVKPTNIYSCRVGLEVDFVKVLDFGLVKRAPGSEEEPVKLTAPNITMGTPAYMAPELARGEGVDHRIDIYALGCVAYYLLTGDLVFEGDTPMKVMVAHIRSLPEPPSKRVRTVPPELDDVVLACLEKDRDRRPSTAQELARRLEALDLEQEWGRDAAWAWWEKHLPDVRPGAGGTAE